MIVTSSRHAAVMYKNMLDELNAPNSNVVISGDHNDPEDIRRYTDSNEHKKIIKDFREKHGVHVQQAWGMTETSPLGTANTPLGKHTDLEHHQSIALMENAGRTNWAVEIRVIDDSGEEIERGGSEGSIQVRGPTVIRRYLFCLLYTSPSPRDS